MNFRVEGLIDWLTSSVFRSAINKTPLEQNFYTIASYVPVSYSKISWSRAGGRLEDQNHLQLLS